MKLLSAGAALTVTGSCHRIEVRGRRVLVDCGLFQGREVSALNREPFPFDPASLDVVIATHGHLDHVGRLPVLVREGYAGRILATRATRAVTDVILQDSAKIQQEDFDRALRRGSEDRDGGDDENGPDEPLYRPGDVPLTMALFEDVPFDRDLDLGGGVRARLRPAGHVLGSAFVEIESPEGRVVCSGDLGNRENALHEDAPLPIECDAVLVETTYGNRTHRSQEATVEEFADVLRAAGGAGGLVMIPSFALERTQAVLYQLNRLMSADEIPRLPVFLDSPMATKMTRLYQSCANEFREPVRSLCAGGEDPFDPPTLEIITSARESMELNTREGGAIVIAGSGMMTGGRIVHHLKHHLHRPEASLVVVGYQAVGTLGRRIVDGAKSVRIHGAEIPVRARVATINGFSAHADRDDLLAWLRGTRQAKVYMVHGEPEVMEAFGIALAASGYEAVAPERNRTYDLG